jgi:hypothetical protein
MLAMLHSVFEQSRIYTLRGCIYVTEVWVLMLRVSHH